MKPNAVLGGGSDGFTASRTASENGARVLFFMGDNADHASLCVNAGCMTSKAVFEPIDAMHHAKEHGWLEVKPRKPDEYLAQIVRWKDEEIEQFRADRQKAIRERASDAFQIIRSNASFVSSHEVVSAGGRYTFDAAIIATGSVTSIPRIEGLDPSADGIWTSDEILHNTGIPKSLAIIGAGAIGLEFSLRYARLGSEVVLLSKRAILPRYPTQFGQRLASIYEREGIRVLIHRRVTHLARDKSGRFVIESDGAGSIGPIVAEKILLATGRRPAVDFLGLEAAGVELDAKGRLQIGDDMRIKGSSHLFAAGDVAGLRMVGHRQVGGVAVGGERLLGRVSPVDQTLQYRGHLFRSRIRFCRMRACPGRK
jgi:pyruvate/2-oxoglutarate dehydrogenase complex dihydrolipoamide dehydrogenase (E3) component